MATRKNNKLKKSNKIFRKTRLKRQRGGTINNELIEASRHGHTEIVEMLLDKGVDVNAKNIALIFASREGHTKTAEILLDAGADVNTEDKYPGAPRGLAYIGSTPLMYASQFGRKEIVEILLNAGANVNAKNDNNYTSLMKAVWNGHKETVEMLLKKGADVNVKNGYGDTALIMASIRGHTEIVRMLLEKKADVNATDKDGLSALMWASRKKHTEIVKLLNNEIRHEKHKVARLITERGKKNDGTDLVKGAKREIASVIGKFGGRKRKKLKGGAQERPPVNVYNMVDELIELGSEGNMRNIRDHNRLQKKYEEIMINIPNANKTDLKEVFVEIHHVMFQPNSDGIIPIDLYHESLRTKLQAIKNKICNNNFINCSKLESDPDSTHFGGKRKSNKSKRKTRKK